MSKLNEYEWEVLEIMDGRRQCQWGAWVSACLESLEGFGLVTPGPNYQLTDAGRAMLAGRK